MVYLCYLVFLLLSNAWRRYDICLGMYVEVLGVNRLFTLHIVGEFLSALTKFCYLVQFQESVDGTQVSEQLLGTWLFKKGQ